MTDAAGPTRRQVGAGVFASLLAGTARAEQDKAVDVRTFGAIGDGVADDTAALIRAHASGQPLIYPNTGKYFRITQALNVQADVLGQGGEIRFKSNGKSEEQILRITRNTRPITISGLVLDGEYEGGTAGEWSAGIACLGASRVTVKNMHIRRPYGDCVYVGSDSQTKTVSRDIAVIGNTLIDPRRCNVAVVSGERVQIAKNVIKSKFGYVAAVDLEPDDNGADRLHDVSILDNVFDAVTCILITQGRHEATTGISVRRNSGQGTGFCWISSSANSKGSVIEGNTFLAKASDGYFLRNDCTESVAVFNNVDRTPCRSSGYKSIIGKAPFATALKDNRFCPVTGRSKSLF